MVSQKLKAVLVVGVVVVGFISGALAATRVEARVPCEDTACNSLGECIQFNTWSCTIQGGGCWTYPCGADD